MFIRLWPRTRYGAPGESSRGFAPRENRLLNAVALVVVLDRTLEGHTVASLDPARGVPDIDVALGVSKLVEVGRNVGPIPGGKELCLFPHLEGIGKFLREQPSPVAPVPGSPGT